MCVCVCVKWLNGKHTVFGKVVEGMEIAKAIEVCGSNSGKTKGELVIEDCGHAYLDNKTKTFKELKQL